MDNAFEKSKSKPKQCHQDVRNVSTPYRDNCHVDVCICAVSKLIATRRRINGSSLTMSFAIMQSLIGQSFIRVESSGEIVRVILLSSLSKIAEMQTIQYRVHETQKCSK